MTDALAARKETAVRWFEALRDEICASYEELEREYAGPLQKRPAGTFERKAWKRTDLGVSDGGGGVASTLKGRLFEKTGVNVSAVSGVLPKEFAAAIPGADKDPRFWAAGISLVAHPWSPHVPAVHFNTRFIVTTKAWFGGGGDMTPALPVAEDTAAFHGAFKAACDKHDSAYHPRFKKWCDEYFFIPHRGEPRGVGGIFFDNLDSGNWDRDFAFVQDVGRAFHDAVPVIYRRRMNLPWSAAEREALLVKRGRYAEFNLIYDRGTLFGLKTGGNIEAILMSLPPEAKWP
ncbi:MAG TPA: oxygen-dependent coproporphyrinogen oxidase [Sphingomonadales bacterium]|nr:oxygen-dependent coproporphyrinogen oxidase [Sphingomonadales bacterium]